jgi:hypothetical protein
MQSRASNALPWRQLSPRRGSPNRARARAPCSAKHPSVKLSPPADLLVPRHALLRKLPLADRACREHEALGSLWPERQRRATRERCDGAVLLERPRLVAALWSRRRRYWLYVTATTRQARLRVQKKFIYGERPLAASERARVAPREHHVLTRAGMDEKRFAREKRPRAAGAGERSRRHRGWERFQREGERAEVTDSRTPRT